MTASGPACRPHDTDRKQTGAVMKKILFAIAALAVLAATDLAHAADMALKAPPPPAPVYSWTGFYVGANAGYGWHDPTVRLTPKDFFIQSQTRTATGSAAAHT